MRLIVTQGWEFMHDSRDEPTPYALTRLRVATDADAGILTRILGHFQNLNLTPRRVVAEFGSAAAAGTLFVQIDLCGLPADRLSSLTAKINQFVPVRDAYWHYL
jgi:hypothetical protein